MALLALGITLGASCGRSQLAQSGNSNTTNPNKGAAHTMLTSTQALEIGYSALKNFPDRDKPGDIEVVLEKSMYRVRFFSMVTEDRQLDHLLEVSVDSQSGSVSQTEDKGRVAGMRNRSAGQGWEKFVSAKQAFDVANRAISGFEEYDKQGPLTVLLRKDVYYITFSLKSGEQTGSRAADFATQVWVDARAGKVLKRLVAS
jgi:hypothetical protein